MRWRYRFIHGSDDAFLLHLNAMGDKGWELVSIEWVYDTDLTSGGEWFAWLKQQQSEETTYAGDDAAVSAGDRGDDSR
jgi:hypothetical protein